MASPSISKADPSRESGERTLALRIAYDGTEFLGWQMQRAGSRTVQGCIENALTAIFSSRIPVHGAGRTDTGVHALGQVAHIRVPIGAPPNDKLLDALNGNLPADVRILKVSQATDDFHARFQALAKTYRYRLWPSRWHHPLERGRSWHFPFAFNKTRLLSLLEAIQGTHDFGGFSANRGTPPGETKRTIYSATLSNHDEALELEFRGDGFLYRMVRMLTGGMMRCVRESEGDPERFLEQLRNPEPALLREAAPAHGLYLVSVEYPATEADCG